jgi:hypothetical protein
MNGVAAEITKEIGVLLQHDHWNTSPRKQIAGHHAGRSTTNDNAPTLQFFSHLRFNHE